MNKDVYVVVEQRGGCIEKVGCELLGKALDLAAALDQRVVAVLLGDGVRQKAENLFAYGASEVVVVDDPVLKEYTTEPYTKALVSVIETFKPEIMLFGATFIGRDLAPRVAARIHTGLTADCTGLDIDPESRLLLMTRPAFGGNIMATIVCREYRPQMATVRPGVMQAILPDASRGGKVIAHPVAFSPVDMNVEILKITAEVGRSVDITAAEVIVSGGLGVGSAQGYQPLRELAAALGGEVAASRAGVDKGWIDRDRQVGQTGKTVRPRLYLAFGISGAIQHLAGMEDSDIIIAVNKDADAPIMSVADLAVVGDLREVVPKLTRAIQKYKEQEA